MLTKPSPAPFGAWLRISGALLLAISPALAGAGSTQEDESKLAAKVIADGTLYGFAKACNLREEDLESLFNSQLSSTREFVQDKVPHYTPDDFEMDFKRGIYDALFFTADADESSESYKRNCSEIQQKVSDRLREE